METRMLQDRVDWEFRVHEMEEGERLRGTVLRCPTPGAYHGNRLFLETEDGIVAIRATVKSGHTLLERALEAKEIVPGDEIEVYFLGWRDTADGERRYRFEEVMQV